MSERDALLTELIANAESNIDTNTETMSPNIQFILSASRFVAGSVENPDITRSPIQYRSHNYLSGWGFD